MSVMEKFSLEFAFNATPRLLYTMISTPEGLSRWFADVVLLVDEEEYLFKWEDSTQRARLIESKENDFVRFEWLEGHHKGYVMEMQIIADGLSNAQALLITDYAEASEIDFHQRIWGAQVKKLQRLFNA